ncbi:MAG: hypothetical protein WBD27_20050 [Pyrinomonadaceae bacterium]
MKNTFLIFTIILASMLGSQAEAAQFTIRIPKIPKIEKPNRDQSKPPEPKTEGTTTSSSTSGRGIGSDQPTIIKDSVQVTPHTLGSYRGNFDIWSWTPRIEFSVNGPIASGDQLYAEFTLPTGQVKFDCRTEERQQGYVWKTSCGGPRVPEEHSSLYTGPVSFAIRIRNELAGSDVALFTGKTKVEKVPSSGHGPKAAKQFVYYVNHDWNLPIGYVFLTPNDVYGMKNPRLDVAFWVRGGYQGDFEPHLFYQGKEVGKVYLEGRQVGKPGCDPEVDNSTSHSVAETVPHKAAWVRVRCQFYGVLGWDKSGGDTGLFGPPFQISSNPGEYEVKVLRGNRLARSIKFTVGADGKFDNGIAAANKLGRDRVIVPVQIIGDQDGTWDRTAWSTEAFYANPLIGFRVN